jgi:hypothetical protein
MKGLPPHSVDPDFISLLIPYANFRRPALCLHSFPTGGGARVCGSLALTAPFLRQRDADGPSATALSAAEMTPQARNNSAGKAIRHDHRDLVTGESMISGWIPFSINRQAAPT